MPIVAAVLAHQGGWDEALMVAAPVAVFVLILWMANKRATRMQSERHERSAVGDAPAAPDRPPSAP
jgi:cyanate permease